MRVQGMLMRQAAPLNAGENEALFTEDQADAVIPGSDATDLQDSLSNPLMKSAFSTSGPSSATRSGR